MQKNMPRKPSEWLTEFLAIAGIFFLLSVVGLTWGTLPVRSWLVAAVLYVGLTIAQVSKISLRLPMVQHVEENGDWVYGLRTRIRILKCVIVWSVSGIAFLRVGEGLPTLPPSTIVVMVFLGTFVFVAVMLADRRDSGQMF